MMKDLLKNRRLVSIAAAVAVVGASALGYWLLTSANEEEISEPALQTATIRQGDLFLLASGTGEVIANQSVELGFGTSGVVAEILVSVGEEVQEGDLLAVQDDQDELELAVASAELAVVQAQQELDDLYDQAELVTAQALLALSEAEGALQSAQYTWTVQQEGNRASGETLAQTQARLVLAAASVERAEAAYNDVSSLPDDDSRKATARINLANARASYDSTLRELNWYTGAPTETQQMALDADLAIAEAHVAIAQADYDRVAEGPDPYAVSEAEIKLRMAEADLEVAQANLEQANLCASMSGTVMSINASVGETVNQSFITIADLAHPLVEFHLDEMDLNMAVIGSRVEVVFDAIPDVTFEGVVVSVNPGLVSYGNVSTVQGEATIELEVSPLSTLPLGISGAVDVIAGEVENAVLVPVEALREITPGQFSVFVMVAGEPELRMVDIGLIDYTYAEVLDGLQAGDVVTTGIMNVE
ncbi:MAG: efflux RND transporter periplasmic adaptor subunit [Anaerolineales bacterium]|nr:efflux RND transporter periplasmic adaptor subunit [Anaerolineales bacterium]